MANAIHLGRQDKSWDDFSDAFLPRWVADLDLAELYKDPLSVGVDFRKFIWYRRALTYAEARSKSYKFESKK